MDINSYLKNETVRRSKIAQDIKNNILTQQEVEELISNEQISSAFFGSGYSNKRPESTWDREYLETISNAASAEAFNAEYLRYLFKVSEYVNKSETADSKDSKATIFIIIGAIVVCISIIILIVNGISGSLHLSAAQNLTDPNPQELVK